MENAGIAKHAVIADVANPMAWTRDTPIDGDGMLSLSQHCRDELDTVAKVLTDNPLTTSMIDPAWFDLPKCRDLGKHVREVLDHGTGYVVIDRLPLDRYPADITTKLFWLLLRLIGRPVAQRFDGEMIYDVTDTGAATSAGSSVRSSKTREGQVYHTDNSFNLPPHHVALLCITRSASGGESGLISFDSVYRRLRDEYPDVLPRLFEGFYFDRQQEHADDDCPYIFRPTFVGTDGVLHVRMSTSLIRQGYVVAKAKMDPSTEHALDALDAVMESADLSRELIFEPGHIQIINNRRLGHRRKAYTDSDDPKQRRHLKRIWLRDGGRPFYLG